MVFHAFKADEEIDTILHNIPKGSRSRFIKDAIKAAVIPEPETTPAAEKKDKKTHVVNVY